MTVLLYRIEQETALRQGDAFLRVSANGTQKVQPDISLNLYVLFVAKFKDYGQGLHYPTCHMSSNFSKATRPSTAKTRPSWAMA